MFTRCRSLSAAEEIKVKQNKVERGRSGITGSERRGDKGVWGGRRGREERGEMWILLGVCGGEHNVSRMLC